jgi:hypothetical protein
LCLVLNQYGLIVAWEYATANVAERTFGWLNRSRRLIHAAANFASFLAFRGLAIHESTF